MPLLSKMIAFIKRWGCGCTTILCRWPMLRSHFLGLFGEIMLCLCCQRWWRKALQSHKKNVVLGCCWVLFLG